MSWVFKHSESRGNARLVLLAIADRANDDGTDAWPSIRTIAEKARVSERTAIRSVQALEELGELAVERSTGGHRSNSYRVVMDPARGDSLAEPRADNLSPRQVVRGDTADRAEVTLVSPDTSLRPDPPQPPASGGRPHCDRHPRYRAKCPDCKRALDPPKPKPPWCGTCDPETRLVEVPGLMPKVSRCRRCHPLAQPDRVTPEESP